VEEAFLENYRLYQNEGELPQGVLPMCYPSDLEDSGQFIPQWDMWYVIEVCEYLLERNPSMDKELFRDSVFGVVNFLRQYENEDGLLEKLPSWNFVEWSKANSWTQDVNYPTNFLYAKVLDSVGRAFNVQAFLDQADAVRKTTAEKAFDGELFVDHAVRNEQGALVNLTDTSEAGQYYALLFGGIDWNEKKYEKLKGYIFHGFDGVEKNRDFVEVNAFIGFYLRIVYLMEKKELSLLKADILRFFGGMEEQTGTLWEYKEGFGSRDHGFASLAALAAVMVDEI
jgi:alpha-L-rhamnosidase